MVDIKDISRMKNIKVSECYLLMILHYALLTGEIMSCMVLVLWYSQTINYFMEDFSMEEWTVVVAMIWERNAKYILFLKEKIQEE